MWMFTWNSSKIKISLPLTECHENAKLWLKHKHNFRKYRIFVKIVFDKNLHFSFYQFWENYYSYNVGKNCFWKKCRKPFLYLAEFCGVGYITHHVAWNSIFVFRRLLIKIFSLKNKMFIPCFNLNEIKALCIMSWKFRVLLGRKKI